MYIYCSTSIFWKRRTIPLQYQLFQRDAPGINLCLQSLAEDTHFINYKISRFQHSLCLSGCELELDVSVDCSGSTILLVPQTKLYFEVLLQRRYRLFLLCPHTFMEAVGTIQCLHYFCSRFSSSEKLERTVNADINGNKNQSLALHEEKQIPK